MSLVLLGEFDFVTLLLEIALFLVSLFLILLVLVQRGKGGGLTGALGGMGGQSAFGTKAGDVFTKFTVGSAIVWILLCVITIQLKNRPPQVVQEESAVIDTGMDTATDDDALDTSDSLPDETKTDGDATKDGDAKQDGDTKKDGDAKQDSDAKNVEQTTEDTNKVESKTESVPEPDAKQDDGKEGETKADEKTADQPSGE